MSTLCMKCKKRPAVVFIQRIDPNSGKSVASDGLCLVCARELGIKPVDDMLQKMGIDEEQLEAMSEELSDMMQNSGLFGAPDENGEDDENADGEEDDGSEENESADGDPSGTQDLPPRPKKPGDDDDDEMCTYDPDEEEEETRTPSVSLGSIFGSFGKKSAEKDAGKKNRKSGKGRKNLDTFTLNLTEKAKSGGLDRVIGREKELERTIQILCRRQKNNPCFIGEPGVGKTAIAEALALKIASGDVPLKLKNKEVCLLDMTAMVAGTQFRGQFENRMKGLIEEVKKLGNILLVIDEVHNIVAAGDAEGGMDAANILKPALSRGEIHVIGATTLAEYRKYIEKDAALERRFQPIIIAEPSVTDTVGILKGIKEYYAEFHGITIPDETVERAVTYSERYITDRYLPDKAIDLLDEAASYLALHDDVVTKADQAKDALAKAKKALARLEATSPDPERPLNDDSYYKELAEAKTDLAKWQAEADEYEQKRKNVVLTAEHLAKVIEIWTGIPASTVSESEFARIDRLAERLNKRIIGQEKAVDAVARAIKRNRAGISAKAKPVSFIFAGPTGVGKTELVRTLAADLFDSPEARIRLDMSEFMEKHSVSRIIGSPPGYVGYDEAGQLTEKVRRRPYCVILFDEIEKAHPDVLNILLQILDDGRITDAHGKEVNFCNTVIIMTTNAGSAGVSAPVGFSKSAETLADDKTNKALSAFLRPEFINRIDEIITFNHLSKDDFVRIAALMLDELKGALAEKRVSLSYSDEVCRVLAERAYSLTYGARNLRRLIQTEVEDKAAELIIASYGARLTGITVGAEGDAVTVTVEQQ